MTHDPFSIQTDCMSSTLLTVWMAPTRRTCLLAVSTLTCCVSCFQSLLRATWCWFAVLQAWYRLSVAPRLLITRRASFLVSVMRHQSSLTLVCRHAEGAQLRQRASFQAIESELRPPEFWLCFISILVHRHLPMGISVRVELITSGKIDWCAAIDVLNIGRSTLFQKQSSDVSMTSQ